MYDKILDFIIRSLIWMFENYWGGFAFIIVGILGIRNLNKGIGNESNLRSGMYYLGWVGAIGMIMVGIAALVMKFLGKF